MNHVTSVSRDAVELSELARCMCSSACGGDGMSLSHAHGFMTAVASGPEALDEAEWIRLIFDEPVFANALQAERILGLALRLNRDIERGLASDGFHPVLEWMRGHGREEAGTLAWCNGYLSGTRIGAEAWEFGMRNGLKPLMAPIHLLSIPREHHAHADYQSLLDGLPQRAAAINRFWRRQGEIR